MCPQTCGLTVLASTHWYKNKGVSQEQQFPADGKAPSFCLPDGSQTCCLPESGKIKISSTKQTHLWAGGGTRLGAVLHPSVPTRPPATDSVPVPHPGTPPQSPPCPPATDPVPIPTQGLLPSVPPSTGHRSCPCPPHPGTPPSVSPHSGPQPQPGLGPPNLPLYAVSPQSPVY